MDRANESPSVTWGNVGNRIVNQHLHSSREVTQMQPQQPKPYSEVVEVEAAEMKRGTVIKHEKYNFYLEVYRRLEQTNGGTAIRYKFADEKQARSYSVYAAARMRQERGKGSLSTSVKRNATGYYVYFARGKKY